MPDERPAIEAALRELADVEACPLIVTTGGTGPAPRDVTPEATEAVCDRLLPGFGELMRAVSLRAVPTAILSRQVAGTRGRSLIVNLPGKPSAIAECLDAVFPAIPYCIDLIGGPRLETDPAALRRLPSEGGVMALFTHGFRPFFLMAGLVAPVAVGAWVLALAGAGAARRPAAADAMARA